MHRVVQQRCILCAGVLRVEVRYITHTAYLPMLSQLISQPHKAVVLIKCHVRPMTVRAAVVEPRCVAILASLELMADTRVQRVV